jgi:hypothetical protein
VAVGKTIMVIVGAILKFKNRWTENFWNCPKDGNLFRLFGHTIPFYVRLVILLFSLFIPLAVCLILPVLLALPLTYDTSHIFIHSVVIASPFCFLLLFQASTFKF